MSENSIASNLPSILYFLQEILYNIILFLERDEIEALQLANIRLSKPIKSNLHNLSLRKASSLSIAQFAVCDPYIVNLRFEHKNSEDQYGDIFKFKPTNVDELSSLEQFFFQVKKNGKDCLFFNFIDSL